MNWEQHRSKKDQAKFTSSLSKQLWKFLERNTGSDDCQAKQKSHTEFKKHPIRRSQLKRAQRSPQPRDPLNRLWSGQPCLWVLRLSARLWMQWEWQYYKDREASLLCQESPATLWLNNEMRRALSEMLCWCEPVHKKRGQYVVFFLMNKVWDACPLDCWCPFCFLRVPRVDSTAAVSAKSQPCQPVPL